jgi:hypothetical protein
MRLQISPRPQARGQVGVKEVVPDFVLPDDGEEGVQLSCGSAFEPPGCNTNTYHNAPGIAIGSLKECRQRIWKPAR